MVELFNEKPFQGQSPENAKVVLLSSDANYSPEISDHDFGLGLDELTIENAQFEGDIETVYIAKLSAGYVIVSLSRITLAGE
jgi:hypothetical protein